MKLRTLSTLTAGAISLLITAQVSAKADLGSLENISKELVDIRQQIANLHDDINFQKDRFNDQLRSYSNQKSDLDVKISRTELNLKELQRELEKINATNKEKFESTDQISPVLKQSIKSLRDELADSIPFKRDQRLNALKDIEYRLDSKLITPSKAANQLWAFVEDELMMGRSVGIYNEVLNIGGEEKLVKVLRLGKVALFYKSSDESYGLVRYSQGNWQQSSLSEEQELRQLNTLFDSYSKNIRNGMFTVPNFLPTN